VIFGDRTLQSDSTDRTHRPTADDNHSGCGHRRNFPVGLLIQ